LVSINPGYDAQGALTFQIVTPPEHGGDPQELYSTLLARLETLPGIDAAGATDVLPIVGSSSFRLTVPGFVSGRYFEAMGIRLLEGRSFSEGDRGRAPEPIVVNREFARRYFGGQPALARVVGRDPILYEVVGVVENVRHAGLHTAAEPEYYVDLRNTALAATIRPYFVVRTVTESGAIAPTIRSVVRQVDPSLGVDLNPKPMIDIVSESVTRPRFQALLLTAFAGVALILAAIGVYGLMAYTVEQRTREIGIRMALGAAPSTVMWLVLGRGTTVTAAGVAVGLLGAAAVTRYLETMLFGLTRLDPITFALGPLTLAVVAAIAAFLPARRATKVDPLVALRCE
jgi:predicted permease